MPLSEAEKREILIAQGLDPDKYDLVPSADPYAVTPTAPVAAPPASQSSAIGSFARSVGRGLIPSFSAAGLGSLGARLGTPLGPFGMLGGALIGGLGGSLLADKGQTAATKAIAPEFSKKMEEQAAIDTKEHGLASTLGGIASAAPFFEVNPGATLRGLSKLPALIHGAASPLEAQAAKNAAIVLGMGGAQGAISPLLSGQTPTMGDIGTGLGQALLFGNTRPWMHSLPGMPALPQAPLQPSMSREPLQLPFETPSTRRERVEAASRGTVEPSSGDPITAPFDQSLPRQERIANVGSRLDEIQKRIAALPDGPEKVEMLKHANDLVAELGTLPELKTANVEAFKRSNNLTSEISTAMPPSTEAPILKGSDATVAAKETGWTFKDSGIVDTTGLPQELIDRLPKAQWEFTDRRPGSPTEGFTVYTPKDANKEAILKAIENKSIEVEKGKNAPNPIAEQKQQATTSKDQAQTQEAKQNGPQKVEPLTEVQQLAGGKMPVEKEAEVNNWLNQILAKNGAGDVHFQLESEMAKQPLDALLTHPQNRAVFDLMDQLSAKHRIERELNPQPGGKEAHGAALISERLIHLNPDNIAPDTFAHEISEIVFQDLLHSPNAADRTLAARGLSIFHGDRERLAQALGRRVTELAQLKVEGLTLKRFKEWFRDFVSRMKELWGKAGEEDFNRLLARRILYGDYVVRNVPADPKTIHYQEVERKQGELTEAGAMARDKVTGVVSGMFRPLKATVERIKDEINPYLGTAIGKVEEYSREYWGMINRVLSGIDAIDGPLSLSKKKTDGVSEYLWNKYDTRGNPTFKPSNEALAFEEKVLRPAYRFVASEARKYGLMIQDPNTGARFIHETDHYMNEQFRGDVIDTMSRQPRSDLARNYEEIVIKHIMDKRNVNHDTAAEEWAGYKNSVTESQTRGQTSYGPLEMPHGIGVPPELREQNLYIALQRYFARASKALAFHRAIQADPVAGYLAGVTDQFGNKFPKPEGMPEARPYGDLPDVKFALSYLKGELDPIDRKIDAFGRLARVGMMQTLTGAVDVATAHAQIAAYVHPAEVGIYLKGLTNLSKGIKDAYDWGVLRRQPMIESTFGEGNRYQGASQTIQLFQKAANFINQITGRTTFEKFARGLTQAWSSALTYSKLGTLASPNAGAGQKRMAIDFMNTFADPGWERTLELIKKSPNGAPDEYVQQIAARLTEYAQGSYGLRDNPPMALRGQLSPFLSLAKWNISSWNRFLKSVVEPAKKGNLTPLLMSSVAAWIGGEAVSQLRQLVSGRKPQEADWNEVLEAGGEGLPYRLFALASYSGFAGIVSELGKQGYDLAHGNQVQALKFPALGLIDNLVRRTAQSVNAVDMGENALETFGVHLPAQLALDNIQLARLLGAQTVEGKERAERANLARNVRVFRQLNNYPVNPIGGSSDVNPFISPMARRYGQTSDISEIVSVAPQLTQEAFQKAGNDPERLKSILGSYGASSSDLVPSMKTHPMEFSKLLNWTGATKGKDAADQLLQNLYKKQALDTLRSELIPRLR